MDPLARSPGFLGTTRELEVKVRVHDCDPDNFRFPFYPGALRAYCHIWFAICIWKSQGIIYVLLTLDYP